MSDQVNSFLLLGCFTLFMGCSKQESNSGSDPILGTWQISSFTPASLTTDSSLTVKDALALFLMDGDLRPTKLTVDKNELTLHTAGGDSEALVYTLLGTEENHYSFQTEEGDAEFVVENAKKARFVIGGATYELYK